VDVQPAEDLLRRSATSGELVGVLVAAGPVVGLASLVASARKLAAALGYDFENGHGAVSGPDVGRGPRRER
jgi:hypothetical protein